VAEFVRIPKALVAGFVRIPKALVAGFVRIPKGRVLVRPNSDESGYAIVQRHPKSIPVQESELHADFIRCFPFHDGL
jgi:hypothetical protein